MFTKKMIIEIIKNDISLIPGIVEVPKESDIVIDDKEIRIHVKASPEVNVIETAKQVITQVRYKLIDKTDEKDFFIRLILK